jgi:hypothetical protein
VEDAGAAPLFAGVADEWGFQKLRARKRGGASVIPASPDGGLADQDVAFDFLGNGGRILADPSRHGSERHAAVQAFLDLHALVQGEVFVLFRKVWHFFAPSFAGEFPRLNSATFSFQSKFRALVHCGTYFGNLLRRFLEVPFRERRQKLS